jgi:hypothetical protein
MGGLWTIVGLGLVIAGLLMASGAFLYTAWGREFRARASAASQEHAPAAVDSMVPSEHKDTASDHSDLLIGRTLITAQKNADDLERAAQARANEIVANAEAIANNVLQSARDEAARILQKTRDETEAVVGAARQKATAWLTVLEAEAEQMVLHACGVFREAQRSVEQAVKFFPSNLEHRAAEWTNGMHGAPDSSVPPSIGTVLTSPPHTGDLTRSFALTDLVTGTRDSSSVINPLSKTAEHQHEAAQKL